MLITSIFSFPKMFSTLPKTNFSFIVALVLSFACALNLDWPKILFFGKELNIYKKVNNQHFLLFQLFFFTIPVIYCII